MKPQTPDGHSLIPRPVTMLPARALPMGFRVQSSLKQGQLPGLPTGADGFTVVLKGRQSRVRRKGHRELHHR